MSTTYDWSPVFQAIQGFAQRQKYQNALGSLFGQADVTPAQPAGQMSTQLPAMTMPGASVQAANKGAGGLSTNLSPLQIGGSLDINTPALPAQTSYSGPAAQALGDEQTSLLFPLLQNLDPATGMQLLPQLLLKAADRKQEIADKRVTPLSDAEAQSMGLRPGGVYGRDVAGNIQVIQQSDMKSPGAIAQANQQAHITPITDPNDPRLPPKNVRPPGAQYGVDAAGNIVMTKLGSGKSELESAQDIAERGAAAREQMAILAGPPQPQALDPNSNNLSAQTGLSQGAINLLTGQTKGQRMTSAMSAALNREIQAWGVKNGINTSTLIPQATANFNVLQNNIQRNNQASILENELMGSAANLAPLLDAAKRGHVNMVNVGKAWAGQQVNDPTAVQIADQTSRFREELAGYNAVAGGHLMENGTPNPSPDDYRRAEQVISNGINSGSVQAIVDSVKQSAAKNSVVLQNSIDNANQAFFSLFGAKYHPKTPGQGGGNSNGGGSGGKNPPPPPPGFVVHH